MQELAIREAGPADRPAILTLLLELHGDYADSVVPASLQDFRRDRGLRGAFDEYLDKVMARSPGPYVVYVAEDWPGHLVGLIIGRGIPGESLLDSERAYQVTSPTWGPTLGTTPLHRSTRGCRPGPRGK
jgi:hypothetical protein